MIQKEYVTVGAVFNIELLTRNTARIASVTPHCETFHVEVLQVETLLRPSRGLCDLQGPWSFLILRGATAHRKDAVSRGREGNQGRGSRRCEESWVLCDLSAVSAVSAALSQRRGRN